MRFIGIRGFEPAKQEERIPNVYRIVGVACYETIRK